MDGLLDQIDLRHAPNETPEGTGNDGHQAAAPQPDAPIPALEFNPYELEPAWRDYPCEWKRPRFAHIPHEIDWVKLYELRQQFRGANAPTKSDDSTVAAPVPGAK